jgi:hypothetical protein
VLTVDETAANEIFLSPEGDSSRCVPLGISHSTYVGIARPHRKEHRKGGWGFTIELSHAEVKHALGVAFAARRAGTPLNTMVTLRGDPNEGLAASKRRLTRKIGHLGQALHRRGQPHIGMTVFERKRGTGNSNLLHCHHLVFVHPKACDVVARMHNGNSIDVRDAHSGQVAYVTKQRQQLPPALERALRGKLWARQAGDYIPGRRLHVTKATAALLPELRPKRRRTSGSAT